MAGTVTGALSSPSAVDIAVVAIATESLPAVAVPSLVETSKETPPSPAGSLRLRTKSNAVLPLLPSARPTLATASTGWPPPAHTFGAEALLRGFGVQDAKSAPLTLVSVQSQPLRSAAVVLLRTGAASAP